MTGVLMVLGGLYSFGAAWLAFGSAGGGSQYDVMLHAMKDGESEVPNA